jgi:hypothetical protein
MGLDMYLTAEKYLSAFNSKTKDMIPQINKILGINGDDDYTAQEIIIRVAYWRKANAIHGWFVKNVQGNIDECEKSHVEREQLQKLIDSCKTVLADHKKAKEILPTMEGFFFGSTKYDKDYFDDLTITVNQLERVLSDPALEHIELYYHSSW